MMISSTCYTSMMCINLLKQLWLIHFINSFNFVRDTTTSFGFFILLIDLYFPWRYLNTYKKYQDLLNNKADTEINTFIQDEPVLLALSKVLLTWYYFRTWYIVFTWHIWNYWSCKAVLLEYSKTSVSLENCWENVYVRRVQASFWI